MAQDSHPEKRTFVRMRIDTPVQLTVGSEHVAARCKDLSGSGMLVATERPLPVGTELEVVIEQEAGNRLPFRASAAVSRCEANTDGYLAGLALIAIHE